MSGKGSRRRAGANDKAFKAAPWPPESPLFRKGEYLVQSSAMFIDGKCLRCGFEATAYMPNHPDYTHYCKPNDA